MLVLTELEEKWDVHCRAVACEDSAGDSNIVAIPFMWLSSCQCASSAQKPALLHEGPGLMGNVQDELFPRSILLALPLQPELSSLQASSRQGMFAGGGKGGGAGSPSSSTSRVGNHGERQVKTQGPLEVTQPSSGGHG